MTFGPEYEEEWVEEVQYDPWPARAEILGAALLIAAVLLILSAVASELGVPATTGFSAFEVFRQRVQVVTRGAGVFPGLLTIGGMVLADLEHIVSGRPPARSDLSRMVIRGAGAVGVVIALAGAVGALNQLIDPRPAFGPQQGEWLVIANAIVSLAGGLLGAAAAWVAASAMADDIDSPEDIDSPQVTD